MRKFASLWLWAVVAILGAAAGPIAAQCSGCGCGGGSSGASSGGSGGSCPTGGCGSSGKTVSRADRPTGATANGSGARRAAGPAVSPEEVPSWNKPSAEALESAAREGRPLVIWFPAENETDASFSGKEIAELSKTSAVFLKIPFTSEREESPWAEESNVPASKLLSDNPSREYGIKVGQGTILVTDSYGNEHNRLTSAPNFKALEAMIDKVADKTEKDNDKLQKTYDKAKAAHEKGDRKGALSEISKNFKTGLVGLAAQEETIRLYHAIMDEARTQLKDLTEKKDVEGLKVLAKEMRKTDVEKEVNEAMKNLG